MSIHEARTLVWRTGTSSGSISGVVIDTSPGAPTIAEQIAGLMTQHRIDTSDPAFEARLTKIASAEADAKADAWILSTTRQGAMDEVKLNLIDPVDALVPLIDAAKLAIDPISNAGTKAALNALLDLIKAIKKIDNDQGVQFRRLTKTAFLLRDATWPDL